MELESIPGVGPKTAQSLRTLDDPQQALEDGDVAAIASIEDMSTGRAARITRNAIRHTHDDTTDFLRTERAQAIYQDLLSLLIDRTITEYAAKRMRTFYPSTTRSRINEVREIVERALERDPTAAVTEALTTLEPLQSPSDVRIRERCLATADAETYTTAQQQYPELSVELVDDARDLAELARGYTTVIALDETFAGIDIAGDVRVKPDALEQPLDIVPERTLAFFATNKPQLLAAVTVHEETTLEPPQDLTPLVGALDRLDTDGTPADDAELARLNAAIGDLDTAVETAASVASDRLQASIRERDVTVEGADLLSLVEQGAGVDSILARELTAEYEAAIDAAREHLIDALQLEGHEAEQAKRVFPTEPTFPIEYDEDAVSRLREELTTARDRRATRQKRALAADLDAYRDVAETLVQSALEYDVERTIAQFAADFECTLPALDWDRDTTGTGGHIRITGGKSPLLDEPHDAIEPVDYTVDGVVILSGVNSGGKTSTLDLLAATVLLAQMGLPVPAAEARITPFDALYYHAKTQGTLDAGAFEATVEEFAELAAGDAGSLVLVDELESITEPGASAKIIAGILETLIENETTAVFVSHLAREIQAAADVEVPVDGIEAQGLVDGELVVDRSPRKNHLARSTPELIVEKLATERDATFYRDLLAKFDEE